MLRQQGMDLSVGSTKNLLQNAAMVDRFIAMSGKSPNMRFNNTDVKSNFYSTVFEPWRNFYKINEHLTKLCIFVNVFTHVVIKVEKQSIMPRMAGI